MGMETRPCANKSCRERIPVRGRVGRPRKWCSDECRGPKHTHYRYPYQRKQRSCVDCGGVTEGVHARCGECQGVLVAKIENGRRRGLSWAQIAVEVGFKLRQHAHWTAISGWRP